MSTLAGAKRKPDDSAESGPSSKRTTAGRATRKPVVTRLSSVRIRLSDKTRQVAGLVFSEFIYVPNVAYLHHISDRCDYLYAIVSRVCGVESDRIKLYIQNDGGLRDEDDGGWASVGREQSIHGGHYLCVIPEGEMGKIIVDPVFISRGGGPQSQASSGASSPRQIVLSPAQSPSKLSTDSTAQPSTTTVDTLGSLTTEKLLKAVVANSLTEKSPEEKYSRTAGFKKGLRLRDKSCVVTGTASDHCEGSHIIPHSLVKLNIQLHGSMKMGDLLYYEPDDPLLGILLEPGINHHFDRYELSIYTGNGKSGVVHLFRTEQSKEPEDWVPSARSYEGKLAKLEWSTDRVAIFDHHYKHAIILAWGSNELKKRLSDFPEAADVEGSFLYNSDSEVS